MKKRIKNKWLKALRSGEYKQCTGALHRKDDEYCCLGVLCDLHAKETGIKWKTHRDIVELEPIEYMGNMGLLPTPVMEWAGLDRQDPMVLVSKNKGIIDLSDLNDNGYSFKKIALLIEKSL